MRKLFIGMTLLAAALLPISGVAQTKATPTEKTQTENTRGGKDCKKGDKDKKQFKQCDKKSCDKKCDKKQCKKGDRKGPKLGKKSRNNDSTLFESLNLTDDQKSRISALNDARDASRKELRDSYRKAREAGDTTFVFDRTAQTEITSKYLKDLRVILTADQYVQFLEGNYLQGHSLKSDGPRSAKAFKKGSKKDVQLGKKSDKSASMKQGTKDSNKGKKGSKDMKGRKDRKESRKDIRK